jgi:hypothetical protein
VFDPVAAYVLRRKAVNPMVTKAFQECLVDVYRGEVAGEAAFDGMLAIAEDAQQRYVIGSLLQFETEGKARVRPLLMRLGLSMLEDAEQRAAGAAGGAQLNTLPWTERFATLQAMVQANYLPRYLELGTLVAPEEDPEAARVAAFMASHERALVSLAGRIAAGEADPVAPVAELLQFPLPRPV